MVKIYNIHSKTISKEDLKELKVALDDNKDVFMLNEDIRYEIIDFDKMSVMKSKNYTKNVYAMYITIKNLLMLIKKLKIVFKVFKVFNKLKRNKQ